VSGIHLPGKEMVHISNINQQQQQQKSLTNSLLKLQETYVSRFILGLMYELQLSVYFFQVYLTTLTVAPRLYSSVPLNVRRGVA
jgi:hypothetical protein